MRGQKTRQHHWTVMLTGHLKQGNSPTEQFSSISFKHLALINSAQCVPCLQSSAPYTLSSTSSAIRRISNSSTIFPECSRISESASVTNSLCQSGLLVPGLEAGRTGGEQRARVKGQSWSSELRWFMLCTVPFKSIQTP